MGINNLLISGTILKEKVITYAQQRQAEERHASNGWFESWKARYNVSFKAIAGEKVVIPEMKKNTWMLAHLQQHLQCYHL